MTDNEWETLQKVATAGTALVALHGLTSKRWTNAHTLFVIVGVLATLGPVLLK